MIRTAIKHGLAAVFVAALTLPALAQQPEGTPVRLRGTIDAFNSDQRTLSITTREGEKVEVQLSQDFAVRYPVPMALSDIGENDFVGAAAVEGEGGKLDAIEVLVFPEAMRAAKPGEGHYPWDLTPGSNMTNATVKKVAPEGEGILLDVQCPEGTKQIVVTPDIPIWTITDGDASLLQQGRYVFIGARKMNDGTYTAGSVIVENNGMKPPN